MYFEGKRGPLLIENSTISDNHDAVRGGGLLASNVSVLKPLVLRASTIAGNSAPFGAGIQLDGSTVKATNVIFANNLGKNCGGSGFENSFYNLTTDISCHFIALEPNGSPAESFIR